MAENSKSNNILTAVIVLFIVGVIALSLYGFWALAYLVNTYPIQAPGTNEPWTSEPAPAAPTEVVSGDTDDIGDGGE